MRAPSQPDSPPTEALQQQAAELLRVVRRQARRPFVVELAGTPKAGKTSVIALVESFFERCGYRVHVLRERAASCPLSMKGHFFFNTWTTASMLAELLEVIDTDNDLVILDRGFFDALVWLDLQFSREQVTTEERDTFEKFVRLDRWRTLVDTVVVLMVSPEVALEREAKGHLIDRRGSLMNEASLRAFNDALASSSQRTTGWFDLQALRADDGADAKVVARRVVESVLPRFRQEVDPKIACLERVEVEQLFGTGGFREWSDEDWSRITRATGSRVRSEVEDDDSYVQLLACGIVTHGDGVFVFDRESRVPGKRYGRGTIWHGPHVTYDGDGPLDLGAAQQCLARRFKDDLHLALPLASDASPLGIVWNPQVGDGHHLGIAFPVEITSDATAEHLKEKKFRTRGRRPPQLASFVPRTDLLAQASRYDLEAWSCAILESGWPTRRT